MKYDLRLLEGFVALGDELHFGRAAARLHLSQPTLSLQVRRFEKQIGVRLFDRSQRHVALTPAGAAALTEARAALAAAARTAEAAQQVQRGLEGLIRLAVMGDGDPFVRPILHQATVQDPALRITIALHFDPMVRTLVAQRTVDAAVIWAGPGGPPSGRFAHRLISRPLTGLVMRADHPLALGPPVPLSELAHHELVIFERHLAEWSYDSLVQQIDPDGRMARRHVPLTGPGVQEDMQVAVAQGGVTPNTRLWFERTALPGLIFRHTEPPLIMDLYLAWQEPAAPGLQRLLDLIEPVAPSAAPGAVSRVARRRDRGG